MKLLERRKMLQMEYEKNLFPLVQAANNEWENFFRTLIGNITQEYIDKKLIENETEINIENVRFSLNGHVRITQYADLVDIGICPSKEIKMQALELNKQIKKDNKVLKRIFLKATEMYFEDAIVSLENCKDARFKDRTKWKEGEIFCSIKLQIPESDNNEK